MDSDEEMIFSSDCVINLDDLPPPQDYQDLLHTLYSQLQSSCLSAPTIKRLLSSDLNDIIRQPNSFKIIQLLLTQLPKYPSSTNKIIAFFFELCQIFMFDPDIPEKTIKVFISSFTKNITEVTHRMLLVYLQRIAAKIVYIEKIKFQVIIQFLKLALRKKCDQGDEGNVVFVVDMLLRRKEMRKLLVEAAKGTEVQTDEQRVFVVKCGIYAGNKESVKVVEEIQNKELKRYMRELIQNQV